MRPTKTPLPIVMPRLPSPFASIRQLSSITTLSPMRILWGCRSTTFWPKIDVAAAGAEQRREQRLAQRQAERAGHVLRQELHQLVVQQRAPARAADDERRVLLARRLPAREQLVLRPWESQSSAWAILIQATGCPQVTLDWRSPSARMRRDRRSRCLALASWRAPRSSSSARSPTSTPTRRSSA